MQDYSKLVGSLFLSETISKIEGTKLNTGPEAIKLFMLNSTEHEIYPAHNVKTPTIVGVLTFIIAPLWKRGYTRAMLDLGCLTFCPSFLLSVHPSVIILFQLNFS